MLEYLGILVICVETSLTYLGVDCLMYNVLIWETYEGSWFSGTLQRERFLVLRNTDRITGINFNILVAVVMKY